MEEYLTSNVVNFWWGIFIFGIFVLIVLRYGVNMVIRAVDARDAKIAHDLREAEEVYAKATLVRQELDERMRTAEAKIADLLSQAQKKAEDHNRQILEQGRVELDALRGRTLREIDVARNEALTQLRSEIAEISVLVAEKLIREKLDGNKQEELVTLAMAAYNSSTGQVN